MKNEVLLEAQDFIDLFESGYAEDDTGTRVAIPEDEWVDALAYIQDKCQN